jgi:hypothetical protein
MKHSDIDRGSDGVKGRHQRRRRVINAQHVQASRRSRNDAARRSV